MMRILFLLTLLVTQQVYSQVTVVLNEPVSISTSVSDLFNLSVVATSNIKVIVKGVISLKDGSKIVEGQSGSIDLNVGVNSFNEAKLNPIYQLNKLTTNNKSLGFGEYLFCVYVLSAATKEEIADDCKAVKVTLINPPFLIHPFNEEYISTKYPIFNWAPPTPLLASTGLTYDFKLCEVRNGQNINDAFSKNRAICFLSELSDNNLQYNTSNYPLDTGIVYCWGVAVKNQYQDVIGITEVWSFKIVSALESETENQITKGYIRLKDQSNLNPVWVKNQMRLIYDERYSETKGHIEILDESNSRLFVEDISVLQGENRFSINLDEISGLKKNKTYTLVFDAEGRPRKFIVFNVAK